MSDPRMISKDAAKRWKSHIEASRMTGNSEYRHWWTIVALHEQVERQAVQFERVRKTLRRIERADEQAQHDWDTKADMFAQGAAMGYSMAAQWLEEALGDIDTAANHAEVTE